MSRLVIVSNRLPITIEKKKGEFIYHQSAGGLASGLSSLDASIDKFWIGWPGRPVPQKKDRQLITRKFEEDRMYPVFLSRKEVSDYYLGFSNKTLWPLFHYFMQYVHYDEKLWDSYYHVNKKFAQVVASQITEDDTVWVHDYQLMLLPAMLREQFPNLSIGFFLHIPFPSYEIFRVLPWRKEILKGLLGSSLIGFHTFGYMRHFLSAVYRITGIEHSFGQLNINNRLLNVDVFPMGIDYDKFAKTPYDVSKVKEIALMKDALGDHRIVISIDRLDYSKGIPNRIRAFERFLLENAEFRGKVTLVMIVVPSRDTVSTYMNLKEEIDELVGRVNGELSTFNWEPIRYFYRSFPMDELINIYKSAQVALVTPLRDGMNLVAKEFVASKQAENGVLILSEMAGASNELTEALLINPQDERDIVAALKKALTMSNAEQAHRLQMMQASLQKYTVQYWARSFLDELQLVKERQDHRLSSLLQEEKVNQIVAQYRSARKRLLLIDYDGTLMDFKQNPQKVKPDQEIRKLLKALQQDDRNRVVVISGRDHQSLEKWLGDLHIDMAAEHGVWLRKNNQWQTVMNVSDEWKSRVRELLEHVVKRTPGSMIEEKDYSLAWHYRSTDKDLGEKRIREFRDGLLYLAANLNLQVMEGNKVIEIKNAGVDKGSAAYTWLHNYDWDFIMAVGDDVTDEDLFKALPKGSITIKVGIANTTARYRLPDVRAVRDMLQRLVGES